MRRELLSLVLGLTIAIGIGCHVRERFEPVESNTVHATTYSPMDRWAPWEEIEYKEQRSMALRLDYVLITEQLDTTHGTIIRTTGLVERGGYVGISVDLQFIPKNSVEFEVATSPYYE